MLEREGRLLRMSRRWFTSGALVLGLVWVLAGCGGTAKKLDPGPVEKGIEFSIAQQSHQLLIVACPNDVDKKAGVTFKCSAIDAKGRQTAFRVTQKDGSGHVHYEGIRR
jgi:hypothetical protein